MNTLRLILRRLLAGIGVLWGAATLTFLALNLSAGDPALAILGGPEAMPSAELIAQVRAEYGLDQPLIVQYGHYLGRLAQGDLGESYRLRIPVGQIIAGQLGATVNCRWLRRYWRCCWPCWSRCSPPIARHGCARWCRARSWCCRRRPRS